MKISVITIAYNSIDCIETAIKSVINQACHDIEYLIIDGGSSDGTLALIKKYADKYSFIRYKSEPDDGIYDALNKGISMATGEVICFIHSDDMLANNDVLSDVVSSFSQKNIDAVYGDLIYVSKVNIDKVIRYWESGKFSLQKIKYGWMPPHPAFFVKKAVYENAKLSNGKYFDTSFKIAADYDFMMRILSKLCINTIYLPKVLVKMRVGGASNRNLSNIIQKSKEDWIVIRRNRIGHIHTLIFKNLRKIKQFFVNK